IAYLLVAGVRERRIIPMISALVVGFFYGGALVSGVLPTSTPHISWEGHLFGAIAGGVVVFLLTKDRDNIEAPRADELTTS
ncbi:MAG TPA: rhomboid family intramembrane serine protease, partial [Pirellulales bacterium]